MFPIALIHRKTGTDLVKMKCYDCKNEDIVYLEFNMEGIKE